MQGYEKFKRIQEEKVATIALLREQIKELQSMVNHDLRKYLPVGKLKPLHKEDPNRSFFEKKSDPFVDHGPSTVIEYDETPVKTYSQKKAKPKNDLEELETQLQDIEHQLKNIQ